MRKIVKFLAGLSAKLLIIAVLAVPAPAEARPTEAASSPSATSQAAAPAQPQPSPAASPAPAATPASTAAPSSGQLGTAPAAAVPMCAGKIVFEDDFKRMDRAWGRRDRMAFVTPNHAFGLGASSPDMNGRLNMKSRYADVDICVSAFTSLTHSPNDAGGITFWADGRGNSYDLLVTVDGRFTVQQFLNYRLVAEPLLIAKTSALKPGTNVPNVLEISLSGNSGVVVINGQAVGSFTGAPPAEGGYIGLDMGAAGPGPSVWGFYRLVVAASTPSSPSKTPGTAPPDAAGLCTAPPLYADDFATLDASWGPADRSAAVQNGQLILAAPVGGVTDRVNSKGRYGDFDACVFAGTGFAPDAAGSAGLIFWGVDAQNFYMLATTANGAYGVFRYAGGEVSPVVPWTPTGALKSGAKNWNELQVRALGDKLTIGINGQGLVTLEGSPPAGGGSIALVAAASPQAATIWAFEQLRITPAISPALLDAAPAPPAAAGN